MLMFLFWPSVECGSNVGLVLPDFAKLFGSVLHVHCLVVILELCVGFLIT